MHMLELSTSETSDGSPMPRRWSQLYPSIDQIAARPYLLVKFIDTSLYRGGGGCFPCAPLLMSQTVRRTASNGAAGGSLLTMPGLTAFNATHEAERRQQLEVTIVIQVVLLCRLLPGVLDF